MWEIFTDGYLPYHDIDDGNEVIDQVANGDLRLPEPPGGFNSRMYVQCFNEKIFVYQRVWILFLGRSTFFSHSFDISNIKEQVLQYETL